MQMVAFVISQQWGLYSKQLDKFVVDKIQSEFLNRRSR